MDKDQEGLDGVASLQGILGYLNFAGGKPDPRFQKLINDAYRYLTENGSTCPWEDLHRHLQAKLQGLRGSGVSAFQDAGQAEGVLRLTFTKLLPAYRSHHKDLLFHLQDQDLFQPFLLVRTLEAVLAQGPPWDEDERIVSGALTQLNDYVGHRPIAILETRPKGEPYDHERVRPIPLFIRGAGIAFGRYHDLIERALAILGETDPSLLADVMLDVQLLDELAVDPRAYDHGHPANRRPNYLFGEWDPHHLDLQGRYRRYVARQVTLDALLDRVAHAGENDRDEMLFEAAAVLAGTILMATGTTGNSPTMHESTTTLSTLMPRIAGYRDAFYSGLLGKMQGAHGERLRQEATTTRQPFGGARQHLNHYLARHRAAQLQQRHLTILFAEMGYPDASKEAAARIPVASVRFLSEILGRLATGQLCAEQDDYQRALALLPEVDDLLRRGIACGALADPWNILGFQGLFPLFAAREDSIRDPRIDELVELIAQIFGLYSKLISETAAAGERKLCQQLLEDCRRLADWWDQFATYEVSDVRRVHGGETLASARHVAEALERWSEGGKTVADLAFWREHLEGFQSPKSFALVVDALMRKNDFRAAMGLLMNWLMQAEEVPLEDGEHSFHALAIRWMLGIANRRSLDDGAEKDEVPTPETKAENWALMKRFFDHLEANAEDYGQVPGLRREREPAATDEDASEEDRRIFSAAYDEVTYKDSADDQNEGSVVDDGPREAPFDLESGQEAIARRLAFLSTVAQLWQIAARYVALEGIGDPEGADAEPLLGWLKSAREHQARLFLLLDEIQECPVPEPLGSFDSVVEYDRRRNLKEQLLQRVLHTSLSVSMAIATVESGLGGETREKSPAEEGSDWKPTVIRLEHALLRGDAAAARSLLGTFLKTFEDEPLLFTSLADGGSPREILRVRLAQAVLRALVTNLPRIGLLRETYQLLSAARRMEQAHPPQGRGVTEFNNLFQAAYQSVVEAVIFAVGARSNVKGRDQEVVDLLERITRPFLAQWVEHSQTLQLSTLETLSTEDEWQALSNFIRTYGHDLFHVKFMTLANLRGILHRGIDNHLDYLRDNADPLEPVRLIEDLDVRIPRREAVRWLQVTLQTLVENYEEYKDYNTTTPQSDYGENLYLLIEFLRVKTGYERQAWRLRPLAQAHEVLARRHRLDLAASWEEAFRRLTEELADQHSERLAELERRHGMRLGTVADRVSERFVKPLALDRLCAQIEPAMREARRGLPGRALVRLEKELKPLAESPIGVGLDVPQWLRRLEHEVQRVRAAQSTIAELAEGFLGVPRKPLPLAELRQQSEDWEIKDEG